MLSSLLLSLLFLGGCSFSSPNNTSTVKFEGITAVPTAVPTRSTIGGTGGDQPASAYSSFPKPEKNFDQHIDNIRQYLQPRSLPFRSVEEHELNLPFQIAANPAVPYRGRFLLFHGLNDSAYVWRDFARAIAKRGFDTRAILFKGHGSTPEDMLEVSYKSWIEAARKHLALWSEKDVPLYLGGFSMGAVIATLLALESSNINGLLLISPAYRSKLHNYLRWSGIYAKFRPWVFGGMILEDNPMKYNSIPVNSGWQFYRLTQKLKSRWGKRRLAMPVLMVATEEDSVLEIDTVRKIFRRRFTHPERHLLIYRGEPLTSVVEHEESRSSRYLSQRIINQSHLSLMNSPDNPLFGQAGSLLVCNGNEYPIFMACMSASGHWYGAQHTPSIDGTAVARTTYNPDFNTVMQRFDSLFLYSKK